MPTTALKDSYTLRALNPIQTPKRAQFTQIHYHLDSHKSHTKERYERYCSHLHNVGVSGDIGG